MATNCNFLSQDSKTKPTTLLPACHQKLAFETFFKESIVEFRFPVFVLLDTFLFISQVSVLSFIVESDHTFLDYIKGG